MERPGAGPAIVVRRLGPGDESVLALLAREDADFDMEDSRGPRTPLGADAARAHLTDPRAPAGTYQAQWDQPRSGAYCASAAAFKVGP